PLCLVPQALLWSIRFPFRPSAVLLSGLSGAGAAPGRGGVAGDEAHLPPAGGGRDRSPASCPQAGLAERGGDTGRSPLADPHPGPDHCSSPASDFGGAAMKKFWLPYPMWDMLGIELWLNE